MTKEQFLEQQKGDGITAQEGLNILIEHFLGRNWYSSVNIDPEMVNRGT